jgi:hypothetical protein
MMQGVFRDFLKVFPTCLPTGHPPLLPFAFFHRQCRYKLLSEKHLHEHCPSRYPLLRIVKFFLAGEGFGGSLAWTSLQKVHGIDVDENIRWGFAGSLAENWADFLLNQAWTVGH